MAVSGSTDFKSTAVTIIEDARRLLGVHAEEEPLQAHEQVTGLRWLTRMLKTWEADPDLGTWLLTEGTLALVASTASYLFGAGGAFTTVPFEMTDSIRIYRGGSNVPMTRMTRQDYYALPNPDNTGFPTQWFYDRQRDSGTLYVWPSPDTTAGTLKFTYRRRIMDLDAGTDNFDLPPEWEDAIAYNLAMRLIPVYGRGGTPEAQQVIAMAQSTLAALKASDIHDDEGSLFVGPDDRDPYRGRRY